MGNNTDWGVDSPTITIPVGAGPGESRTVIGPQPLPPPLDTYQFFGAALADSGIIAYQATPTDDDYQFLVHIPTPGQSTWMFGAVLNGAVIESSAAPGRPASLFTSFDGSGKFNIDMFLAGLASSPGTVLNDWRIDGVSQGRGPQSAYSCAPFAPVTMASSGGAEVTVPAGTWTLNPGPWMFYPNRIYRLDLALNLYASAVPNRAQIRVRRTGGGTEVLTKFWSAVQGANAVESHDYFGYLMTNNPAGLSAALDLTIQRIGAAGTVNLYAEATAGGNIVPCSMNLVDVTDQANAGLANAAKII